MTWKMTDKVLFHFIVLNLMDCQACNKNLKFLFFVLFEMQIKKLLSFFS